MDVAETKAAKAFLAHHGFVKGISLKYAPWPGLVDDILQQVFVEFVAKSASWDLEQDPRPLLAVMTRNVAARYLRERLRTQPETVRKLAEHLQRLAENSAEEPERFEEEVVALRGCVAKLPPKSRQLVHLFYDAKLAAAELSKQMKVKNESVYRALARIRDKLRVCIRRTLQTRGDHAF